MPSRVSKTDSFSRTFMCLSFATAALLIAVQLRFSISSEKPAASPAFSSSFIVTQPSDRAESISTPLAVLPRLGWAMNLQTALNPNPLAKRSGLIVDLSDRQVSLFQDGNLVGSHAIAIGQTGWETPTGQFKVTMMQTDPVWQHPFTGEIVPSGMGNPLGSRWIGFWTNGTHQLGLHGTHQDDLIGQAVSHGCIRLSNADIEALYNQVAIGTSILIRP